KKKKNKKKKKKTSRPEGDLAPPAAPGKSRLVRDTPPRPLPPFPPLCSRWARPALATLRRTAAGVRPPRAAWFSSLREPGPPRQTPPVPAPAHQGPRLRRDMRDLDVPVVDLAELDEREGEVAEEIFCACAGIGFFYVKNHGLPQCVIDKAFAASESFFNLPDDDKRRYPYRKGNTGYTESFNFVPSSTLQKTELPEDLERGGLRDFEKVAWPGRVSLDEILLVRGQG
ncbi:MAG: hypothetical protein BJ554DRAFT_2130, partial [Olpidium bornovanus]